MKPYKVQNERLGSNKYDSALKTDGMLTIKYRYPTIE